MTVRANVCAAITLDEAHGVEILRAEMSTTGRPCTELDDGVGAGKSSLGKATTPLRITVCFPSGCCLNTLLLAIPFDNFNHKSYCTQMYSRHNGGL